MTRDYKGAAKKKSAAPVTAGGVLSFVAGLSVGLLVAYGVYLHGKRPDPARGQLQELAPADAVSIEPPRREPDAAAVPTPTFDFYQILPSREVNVSEWIAEDSAGSGAAVPAAPPAETGASDAPQLIQVGSFETFEAADQTKAQLAMIGIGADIQRVVINGQDVRHRVRIGPFTDPARFEETRQRLAQHGLKYMVLKLGDRGAAAPDG
jgi:cell division protein FtsN